jgi:hypothetical protein
MTGWDDLEEELAQWAANGRVVELWWRDDDAVADSVALRRLLDVATVPLALAVIPSELQPSLAEALARSSRVPVAVLQHGFSHRNHEPEGRKKAELGTARDAAAILAELATGANLLAARFGALALPVLTPPWNRIAPGLLPMLPTLGLQGISTYLPRAMREPAPGLRQVNTHVDIIDWHGGRQFIGEEATLALLARHLRAKRLHQVDPAEPTGLLTHHLVQDAASWLFLSRLQDWLSAFPMIRWRTADAVFAIARDRT